MVVVSVDSRTGAVLQGPEIVTRGWVYGPEAEELLGEARAEVLAALADPPFMDGPVDVPALQRHMREALQRYINRRTRRRPWCSPW